MRDWLSYFLLSTTVRFLGILPAPVTVTICKSIAYLWYVFDRSHHAKILTDIDRTPLSSCSSKQKRKIVRDFYLHLGVSFAEFCKLRRWPADRIIACVDFEDGAELLNVVKEGRGALMIAAHFGNWELTGLSLPLLGVPTAAVARPLDNKRIDGFLVASRTRFGQRILTKFNVMLEIIRNLKAGYCIGVLIDQDAEKDSVFVPFLGEIAGTSTVQAKLAVRYNLPVFCVVAHRIAPFKHKINVIGPIKYPTEGDDAVTKTCEVFNNVLSQVVLEHPEQWLWLHHRWRTADKRGLTAQSKKKDMA